MRGLEYDLVILDGLREEILACPVEQAPIGNLLCQELRHRIDPQEVAFDCEV